MRFWMTFSDLKDIAHQIHFYEHDAWMGEYNIDEVGEYLKQFSVISSGEINWLQRGYIYPSRAGFIRWKTSDEQDAAAEGL